jgi:predicted metal-binding membrane protein
VKVLLGRLTAEPSTATWPLRRLAREQAALAVALFALAGLCWWLTDRRMDGMAMRPTTDLGGLGFYTTVWVVMMAAMMFPSVWPVVGMYERVRASRAGAPRSATALIVAGYLLTWTLWGVLAFGAIRAARVVFGDFLPWDGAGRWVAAGVVLGAAVYQLTPLKNACLTRCRGPLMFVMANWRPGRGGALRMGVVHGAWCVGCCWALMAALFALGVMSLGWMALIAGLVAAEKLWPSRAVANYGVAAVLVILAVALAVDPSVVPGMPDAAPAGGMRGGGMPGDSMETP